MKGTLRYLAVLISATLSHRLEAEVPDSLIKQVEASTVYYTIKGKGKVHPRTGHEGPEGE
jgi:hypothetical protein